MRKLPATSDTLFLAERLQSWKIRQKKGDGRSNKFFHHQKSRRMFRFFVQAKPYIVYAGRKQHLSKKRKRNEPSENEQSQETGYVGLKNQGATSYMNSLLQTLYHIPYFRKAVYDMPINETAPFGSISSALQSLFYKVQYGDASVATNELTKSFEWNTYDSFMQHDAQELTIVLCEKLEDTMKTFSLMLKDVVMYMLPLTNMSKLNVSREITSIKQRVMDCRWSTSHCKCLATNKRKKSKYRRKK